MADWSLVANLLPRGESDSLDWKADYPPGLQGTSKDPRWDEGKATLLKDLISIANAEGPEVGHLIYGVKDHRTHREVVGLSKSWDDAMFQDWASRAFDPPPSFLFAELTSPDGKRVGVFEVHRIPVYPHVSQTQLADVLHDGQVWFRRGSKNSVAHHNDLVRMVTGEQPFKFATSGDPQFEKLLQHFREQQREPCMPLLAEKDSRLLAGYEVAYFPGTRREVWVGELDGRYEGILMLKPRLSSETRGAP